MAPVEDFEMIRTDVQFSVSRFAELLGASSIFHCVDYCVTLTDRLDEFCSQSRPYEILEWAQPSEAHLDQRKLVGPKN